MVNESSKALVCVRLEVIEMDKVDVLGQVTGS